MNLTVQTKWIVGRNFYDLNNEVYCAVIIPTSDEIQKKKLDNKNNMNSRLEYWKLSDIEKEYNIKEKHFFDKNVQISKFGNNHNISQETLPQNAIDDIDIEIIENIIYSKLYNKYNPKWLIGSYRDDYGDFIYVFTIPTKEDPSITNMYNDEKVLRIKEFPFLKNNNLRPSKLVQIVDNEKKLFDKSTAGNANHIDHYVANNLMLNKWKKRLLDTEKYKEIWVFEYDNYNKRWYCVIPTDEEIKKNILIDTDRNRVRYINQLNPKNCIMKENIIIGIDRCEKFYIPYRIFCKFNNDICILEVNQNEITWTIDDPIYEKYDITFHTNDSDILSNFMRIPWTKQKINFIQYFQIISNNQVLKINPIDLEKNILKSLQDYGYNILKPFAEQRKREKEEVEKEIKKKKIRLQ